METKTAWVFVGSVHAGTITQTQNESTFNYEESFAGTALPGRGIALNLPRVAGPISTPGFYQHPFFANLLPEGHRLDAIRTRHKISKDDGFGLLLATGSDTVGDVSVVGESQIPMETPHQIEDTSRTDFMELLELDEAGPSGVPGVQEKVSDARLAVSVGGIEGPCLLKLSPPKFPRLVENEAFFMAMADACGIEAASTKIVYDAYGRSGLLVRRFDRDPIDGKRHQEDACQLANVHPGAKYNLSVRDVVEAVNLFVDAKPVQIRRLMELFAFSYLIGNGDLHAKNVSILRTKRGLLELSPAYDLLSTLPYPLDQRMALKMDGKDDGWKRKSFVSFFGRYEVPEKLANVSLDRMCDIAPRWIDRLEEIGLDDKSTAHSRREMLRRLKDLG